MSRRSVAMIAGWTLVASLLVVAPSVVRYDQAGAEGFNFLCEAPGGGGGPGGGPSEFEQLAQGLAVKILTDQAFWIFSATVPAGIPVTAPGAITDPVTGETSFTMLINPKLGFSQRLNFIDGNVVPGAAGDEIRFGYAFRNKAGQRADDLSMKELFTENYGLPLDPGNDIDVIGVDITFETNEIMGQMEGFRGRFGAAFNYKLADGSTESAVGTFRIDSDGPGYRIPEEATLSLSTRKPPDSTSSFIAFGQRAIHDEFDGVSNQPGAGFGIDLSRITPGTFTEDPFVTMDLGWSAAPRSVAVGIGSLCPDKGHFAWNHSGLPNPAAANLDVDVAYGIEEGLPIQVDEGSGPVPRIANIVDVEGSISGLPSQMDVILLRDAMSFTRSPDVAPDVSLTRLAMADDDPADPDDLPLHATAEVTDLPRHLLATFDRADDGSIEAGDITSWTLACPSEPAPVDPPAPEGLRRLDLPETLPGFPVGCERHALTPIPSAEVVVQNWLPEDVLGQAAAAGLAAPPLGANQFAYFATRTNNSLSDDALLAFGGRINGFKRASFDFTEPPADGERTRVYVERDPVAAADDSIRVVGDVDGLTSTDPALNTGARFQVAATISDLPDAIRLDLVTDPTTPLELTWRADAPIAVTDGTFDAQLKAPEAVMIQSAFETGAIGAGALPPAASLRVTDQADGTGGAVRWSAPVAPTDDFPSPTVPDFDPSEVTRVHAGAIISTFDDRAAGLGTRVHGDIEVPQPVSVSWKTDADGTLESFTADFCDPDDDAACAATVLDATAVKGPQSPLSPAELLTAPPLPAIPTDVSEGVVPFTDFRPGSGVRALLLETDLWGIDGRLTGLAHMAYAAEPTDIAVRLANTDDQPFRVNLLDASKAVDLDGDLRRQILFADIGIDRLPEQIRVRQQDVAAGSAEPWLWVNTEDLSIDDLDDVDFTEDPAGTRPQLTGILRLGDLTMLREELAPADRPTPARTVNGADVWADYDLGTELFAMDAATSIEVPRHVAIFRPTLVKCDATADDISACQDRPNYEIDQTQTVGLQFRTTSAALGDLNIEADIHGDDLDWTIRGRVGQVPGQFLGAVELANNVRLPWITVDVDIEANEALGDLRVEVFDHNLPVEYRESGDPDGEGQCTEADDQCTANYGFELLNVADELHISARVQGAAEERLTPSAQTTPDPSDPETSVGGIGYVHGAIDLGGTATQLVVEGREASDGQFVGILQALDGDGAPAAVSGFLNARVDHVEVDLNNTEDAADPFSDFVFDGGGLVGAIFGNVTVGRIFQIITFPLDLLIGLFLEIFFEGDITSSFDLDFDLPLFVEFDQADTVRFGMNGTTLSVDERHPGDGAPATIATRQQAFGFEDDLQVDGAFYHHRIVEFSYDAILEDFSITSNETDTLGEVGLFRHADCLGHDEDDPCYELATNSVTLDQVSSATERGAGFSSGDILIDFIMTPGNRDEMDDENAGFVEPGVEFYKSFADSSDPVAATAFFVPDLASAPVASSPATFGTASYCCNTTTYEVVFGSPPPPPQTRDFGAVCDVSTADDLAAGPRAVGRDGTEYLVAVVRSGAVPANAERTLCDATRLMLQAHFPANPAEGAGAIGPLRWSIALPVPAGMEPGGACVTEDVRCEVSTVVTPQADGSVQVESSTTVVEDGVDGDSIDATFPTAFFPTSDDLAIRWALFVCCPDPVIEDGTSTPGGTVRAWPDASGHPGFHRSAAAQVPDFSATSVTSDDEGDDAGTVTLDPCAIAPTFGCGALPAGHTAQWLFGDGSISDPLTALATLEHRYPRTPGVDAYLGILVHYDENGEVAEKAYITISA